MNEEKLKIREANQPRFQRQINHLKKITSKYIKLDGSLMHSDSSTTTETNTKIPKSTVSASKIRCDEKSDKKIYVNTTNNRFKECTNSILNGCFCCPCSRCLLFVCCL
jgi:hypothetical protein